MLTNSTISTILTMLTMFTIYREGVWDENQVDDLPVLSVKYSSTGEDTRAVEHDGATASNTGSWNYGALECGLKHSPINKYFGKMML